MELIIHSSPFTKTSWQISMICFHHNVCLYCHHMVVNGNGESKLYIAKLCYFWVIDKIIYFGWIRFRNTLEPIPKHAHHNKQRKFLLQNLLYQVLNWTELKFVLQKYTDKLTTDLIARSNCHLWKFATLKLWLTRYT